MLPIFDSLNSGVSSLSHLGVIRVEGEDAASFLHNQLTNDVLLLDSNHCRLGAYCNAKGRMQVSVVYYKRAADEILLICRRDLLPQTIKRLSMFVLRAKVKLSDASAEYALRGLVGDAMSDLCTDAEPWQRHMQVDGADVLTLYPALEQPRALWIAPIGTAVPEGAVMSEDEWQFGEVMSGVAWVEQATFEAFIPQMLNYESVDGVNFKKGCYPGQEVVARSQFRGTLKRRAFIVQSAMRLQAGQEVFSSTDAAQPCGLIAQAASLEASHVAIAELQVAATEGGSLHIGAPQGAELRLLPLPYALRDDI